MACQLRSVTPTDPVQPNIPVRKKFRMAKAKKFGVARATLAQFAR